MGKRGYKSQECFIEMKFFRQVLNFFQIKYFWWFCLNGFLILPVNVLGWWKLCRSFDSPQHLFNMNSGHQFSFLISQSKTLSRQAGRQNQNQQYFIINNEYFEQMNTFLHHSLNLPFVLLKNIFESSLLKMSGHRENCTNQTFIKRFPGYKVIYFMTLLSLV